MYVSRRTRPQDDLVLKGILDVASLKNSGRDITGLLISDDEYFLQILEGRLSHLSSLFEEIYKDSRHCDVRLLLFHAVESRLFKQWAMGSLPAVRASAYYEGKGYMQAIFQSDPGDETVIGREEIEKVFLWFAGQKEATIKWANVL